MRGHFSSRTRTTWDRFQILFVVACFLGTCIVGKLAWLQLVHAGDYRALAEEQNSRGVVLPAKRGTIFARDSRTGETFPLAQNSTTYTIFADPLLLESGTEMGIADQLLPHLYIPTTDTTAEAAEGVSAHPATSTPSPTDASATPTVASSAVTTPTTATLPDGTVVNVLPADATKPDALVPPPLDPKQEFRQKIIDRLATKSAVRREIRDTTPEERQLVMESHLTGVTVEGEMIIINPTLIEDAEKTATQLATILSADFVDIRPLMNRRKIRYVKLASNVASDAKDAIVALDIRGVGVIPEYRRVYPEKSLAAQVVGFLNHDEQGAYGIEEAFQKELAGKNGKRRTQVDPFNRQITAGDITIEEATDGADVVLTIDRAIQATTERALGKAVDDQRADSGQAIVMDPRTGAVLALAHYPTFDINSYADAYEREELVKHETKKTHVAPDGTVTEEVEVEWRTEQGERITTEWERDYIVRQGYRFPIFTEIDREGAEHRVIYENRLGPAVFTLRALTEPYEPGSIFKPVVMSMALDAGEVTPQTRSPYSQPVDLGEKLASGKSIVIKNALGHYFGRETMSEVIEHSSNIGMTFVVEKLGAPTFYDYLKKFGFGDRTDIELDGENAGRFENYTRWTRSELVTKSFGQGLTVNLIQMATAYSALANGGLLMKPYIVDQLVSPDGRVVQTEPETVRRVINPETSAMINAIMISSVQRGFAKSTGVPGYYVGGKTGTSQTYGKSGQALFGVGTTIAGYGGYAPATDPKYVMIVRVDRPRTSEWGEGSAGVVFKAVSEELLKNYFGVPPVKDL